MKTSLLVLVFFMSYMSTTVAQASTAHTISTWDCGAVTLTTDLQPNHESASGTVTVMGHTFKAAVHRDGLALRWDFNNDHSMLVSLDGYAYHYNWTGAEAGESRNSQAVFECFETTGS